MVFMILSLLQSRQAGTSQEHADRDSDLEPAPPIGAEAFLAGCCRRSSLGSGRDAVGAMRAQPAVREQPGRLPAFAPRQRRAGCRCLRGYSWSRRWSVDGGPGRVPDPHERSFAFRLVKDCFHVWHLFSSVCQRRLLPNGARGPIVECQPVGVDFVPVVP